MILRATAAVPRVRAGVCPRSTDRGDAGLVGKGEPPPHPMGTRLADINVLGTRQGGAVDTLLDRGSEDLAATRADRYLLILARLRALEAYDRCWLTPHRTLPDEVERRRLAVERQHS